MKYDVFISYSSKDAESAKRVCAICERNKITCFLAERDIPKGVLWAPYIVNAIAASSVMVALFSKNYNLSIEVDREIALASVKRIPILVYRIDMSNFEGAKAYYFSNLNWFSSIGSNEESGNEDFIQSVLSLLDGRGEQYMLGNPNDFDESILLASSISAANNGDSEAQFYLGCFYEENLDNEKALVWYRKAAEAGLPEASYNLSRI